MRAPDATLMACCIANSQVSERMRKMIIVAKATIDKVGKMRKRERR